MSAGRLINMLMRMFTRKAMRGAMSATTKGRGASAGPQTGRAGQGGNPNRAAAKQARRAAKVTRRMTRF